jgi:two-component system sensor histidine kinase ArlS
MKRMSLQWRLTCITTLCIAIICGCLTMFVYKNGVHYIDSLQDAVESQWDEKGNKSDEIYISIPEDKWDEFAKDFSVQVYNNKADYKRNSLIITVLLALLGGVVTYFISGHALRSIREFSDKIEEVQAQNLSDSRIEENNVKELNQLGISYNKMLERLSEAFEIQRQFTANAAHELRTPLALMQVQLDLYNSASHPGNDADTLQTIKMVTEQNDKLNRMVKTLLDMSELQTVGRDDKIILDAIVEEVLADLEPLAVEKNIKLIGKCEDATMIGSDILIYRLVYNLVENAIKYNHPLGQVTVTAYQRNKHVYLSVEDTGSGIPKELRERVFEPFFRVDKSRSRELGGVGLGLAFVREIVRVHDGSICIKSGKTGGTIFEVTFAQHSMSKNKQ